MDSFEWNKIAGAILFALLLSVGLSIFSDVLFETEAPESPGYVIAVATGEGAPAAEAQPIAVLLAAADPKAGENSAKKCLACHTFASGEANKVGPNLWSVVNRPIAAHEGYKYNDAMHSFAETAKTWTFDNLNTFLHDPKGTVPGTKMAFPGLKADAERANVIAYLRTLSDSPAPLPEAAAAEAPAAETEVAAVEPEGTATDAAPAAEAPAAEVPAPEAPAEAPAAAEQQAAPAEAPTETAEAPAPAEQEVAQTEAPAAAPAPTAAGDPAAGENFAARCKACHSFAKDGPNQVGPHLFGVVGRPIATVADFNYSEAMKTFSEGGAKLWDEAALDTYLGDPKGTIPGSKMAFPGVKKDTDRANLIAYLKTLVE
jgi:cytochrome c2